LDNTGSKLSQYFPLLTMGCLTILVDCLALLVTNVFNVNGAAVFEDPNDPSNLLYLIVVMLLFTGVILVFARFHLMKILKGIFLFSSSSLILIVIYLLISTFIADPWAFILSISAAIVLIALLIKYPEWYVVDICGVILGVGSIVLFGISLSVPLVVALLIIMAVYDAISVYKTKHMIDLADAVVNLRIPAMLVVPKNRDYSFIKEIQSLKEKIDRGEKREAFFMGLGDIVFPGILAESSFFNIAGNGLTIAISVIIGTLFGFVALSSLVIKGKPQAGLPFLCSGAILGYLISTFLLYGRFFV
jgi:presenilin-like A22 family membrane protease